MNRRTALRNVVIISAGASLLPSCLSKDKVSIPLKNISLTGSQEKMLAELADSEGIIPPDFQPVGIDEQGRLDEKSPITCPHCKREFVGA